MPLSLLLLLVLPPLTGALCWVTRRPPRLEKVHIAGSLGTLIAGLALALEVFVGGPARVGALHDLLYVDALGALLIVVVAVVCFLAALYSVGYLRHDVETDKVKADQLRHYYAGYHAFVWTMLAVGAINNLGLLWVAVEATTIVSALLVGFYRTQAALEAAWKYLILCSVGILFALFGILLTYYAAAPVLGQEAGLNWTVLVANAGRLDPGMMKAAFVFVLVGFGTKAGFAPLHTWLPDAHSQAPSPISALLSGVLLKCGLYGILRFHLILIRMADPAFSANLLLWFGLLSVAVAVPFILVQRDLKRLLAYHSVEHIGLLATAIGLGGPIGFYAGLLHLFNHAMAKALLFFVAGNLSQRYGTTQMGRIRGAAQAMPATGALLLLGTLAITGVPPFAIFLTEFGIVAAAFASGHVAAAVILIGALAIVFAGAFGHAADMAWGRPRFRLVSVLMGRLGTVALAVPAVCAILFGVYVPPPVSQAIQQIVQIFTER